METILDWHNNLNYHRSSISKNDKTDAIIAQPIHIARPVKYSGFGSLVSTITLGS